MAWDTSEAWRMLAAVGCNKQQILAALRKIRHLHRTTPTRFIDLAHQFCARLAMGNQAAWEAIDRARWWTRGEAPPEYVAEYEPPEWWQEGEEPPDFGCAA